MVLARLVLGLLSLMTNVLASMPPRLPSYYEKFLRSGGGPFRLRHHGGLCVNYDHESKLLKLSNVCSYSFNMTQNGGLYYGQWCIIPSYRTQSSTASFLMVSKSCEETYTIEQLCMQPHTEEEQPQSGIMYPQIETEQPLAGTQVVSDCMRFSSIFPEFTCSSSQTGLHLHMETWLERSCVNCTCGMAGLAYCEEKYSKVNHEDLVANRCYDCEVNNFASTRTCKSYDHYVTLQNIQENDIWNVTECVWCQLKSNKFRCHPSTSNLSREFARLAKYIPNNSIQCDEEDYSCIKNFFTSHTCSQADCLIHRVSLKHGDVKSFTLAGVPNCVTCGCFHGVPLCTGNWKNKAELTCANAESGTQCVDNLRPCASATKCKLLFDLAPEVCRYPGYIKCTESYSWSANGCQYTCSKGEELEFDIINKPWCQRLTSSDYCAMCGNKTEFLARYGSVFSTCNISGEVISKDEICDGKVDCVDKTDEENCANYFCKRSATSYNGKSFFWPRTIVNETLQINCSSVFSSWTGIIQRTCQMVEGEETRFTGVDFCSCVDVRPNFTFSIREEVSSFNLFLASRSLLSYLKAALTPLKYVSMAHRLMELSQSVNSTDRSFLPVMRRIFEHKTPCMEGSTVNASRWEEMFKTLPPFIIGHTASAFIASYKDMLISELRILQYMQFASGKNAIAARSKPEIDTSGFMIPMRRGSTGTEKRIKKINTNNSINININISMIHANQSEIPTNRTTSKSMNRLRKRQRIKEIRHKLYHINIALKIEIVIGSFSVLSCIMCLIMYKILRVEHNTKFFLHKNLFLAWIFAYGMQIIGNILGETLEDKKNLCTAYLIISHYWVLAFFCWMLLEGLNLLIVLIVVFSIRKKKHILYAIAGWGLPLCITFMEVSIFLKDFQANRSCLGLEKNVWLFKGPAAFLLGANCILFLSILVVLVKSVWKSSRYTTASHKSRATGKSFVVLLPLTGVTYILGFAATNLAVLYVYTVLNSMMGLMLAVFHFALDATVQSAFENYRRRGKPFVSSSSTMPTISLVKKSYIYENTAM